MIRQIKRIVICFLFIFFACIGRPVFAQIYHPQVTFKDSLVQLLYQYGREVYYRGLDPQEAAFVFQRILVLDCHHGGAQDFIRKIQKRYPNVSIRIKGCSEAEAKAFAEHLKDVKSDIPDTSSIHPPKDYASLDVEDDVAAEEPQAPIMQPHPKMEADHRSTPVIGYSKPLTDFISPQMHSMDEPQQLESSSILVFPEDTGEPQLNVQPKETPKGYETGLPKDCEGLRVINKKLVKEIAALQAQIQAKESMIVDYQKQLAILQGRDAASYASIAEDQKDLIRIQQGNIDYLQNELTHVKGTMMTSTFEANPEYDTMHREIASTHLIAHEKEMNLEAKNQEAQTLQKQLGELQEQLRLVKKILSEKNDTIKSLQEELETIKAEND